MSIFRKSPLVRSFPDGDDSVGLTTQLVKDNVIKNGSDITLVHVRSLNVKDLPLTMPTKDEYSLEEQLKAGVNPEAITVTGMLGSDDSFDVNGALNTLYKDSNKDAKPDDGKTESSES